MAILDHHRVASPVDQRGPLVKVQLRATAIQLHSVKAEHDESRHIALVHRISGRLRFSADAIVPIPAGCEAEAVRMVSHLQEVGKALPVDDGDARIVMVAVQPTRSTLLPIVIQAHVAVP